MTLGYAFIFIAILAVVVIAKTATVVQVGQDRLGAARTSAPGATAPPESSELGGGPSAAARIPPGRRRCRSRFRHPCGRFPRC